MDTKTAMYKFSSFIGETKVSFVMGFDQKHNDELAEVLLGIVVDDTYDLAVRIESAEALGLYRSNNDDYPLRKKLCQLILKQGEDEKLIVCALDALASMHVGELEIKLCQQLIVSNKSVLIQAAAFNLIKHNKKLEEANQALRELCADSNFGDAAKKALEENPDAKKQEQPTVSSPAKIEVGHYLLFNGNCSEALQTYQEAFDAVVCNIKKYGDMPADPQYPVSEEIKDRVLNASIKIGNTTLLCADASEEATVGETMYVTITCADKANVEKAWEILAQNGEVYMELQETFFARVHGSLRDQYGINWMFTVTK